MAKVIDPRTLIKIDPAVEAAEACAKIKEPTRDEIVAARGLSPVITPAIYADWLKLNRDASRALHDLPLLIVESDEWRDKVVDKILQLAATTVRLARRIACDEYLAEFGRLPGSERTSRLRKKRRDKVLRWFVDDYLPNTFGKGAKP